MIRIKIEYWPIFTQDWVTKFLYFRSERHSQYVVLRRCVSVGFSRATLWLYYTYTRWRPSISLTNILLKTVDLGILKKLLGYELYNTVIRFCCMILWERRSDIILFWFTVEFSHDRTWPIMWVIFSCLKHCDFPCHNLQIVWIIAWSPSYQNP